MLYTRPACIDDAEAIFRFVCLLNTHDLPNYTAFNDLFSQNLHNPNIIYLVAVTERNVVGFISCHGQILLHHGGWVFEIQELFVDESHRSIGIGKLLIKSLEEMVVTRDYKSLEVTSHKKRIDAHKFFIDHGFIESHLKFTK